MTTIAYVDRLKSSQSAERISLDIDSDEEVVDMCKAWSVAQKNAAIKSAVETARQFGGTDEAIIDNIMRRFDLTESEAKAYLLKEVA